MWVTIQRHLWKLFMYDLFMCLRRRLALHFKRLKGKKVPGHLRLPYCLKNHDQDIKQHGKCIMVIIYWGRRKIKFLAKHLQLAFSWTNFYLSKF